MKKLRMLSLCANLFSELPVSMWMAYAIEDINLSKNPNLKKLPVKNLSCFREIWRKSKNSLRSSKASASDCEEEPSNGSKPEDSSSASEVVDFEIVSTDRPHVSKPQYKRVSFFEKHYISANDVRPQQNFCYDEGELHYGLRLHTLTVRDSSLEELPYNLACLAPRLHYLYCERNKINNISIPEQFPPTIMGMNFDSNELTSIEFLRKQNLSCMRSSENWIVEEDCADCFDRKDSPFHQAHVERCKHNSHMRLEILKSLDLSHNKKLTTVEFDYLERRENILIPTTRLPALGNLHINDCNLKEISDSITRLRNLGWLQINNNPEIRTIPEDIALLDKLQTFSFEGCQVADEMLRNHKGSAKNILNILSAKREGKSAWRRLKLMFMGESNAGKTSLVKALAKCGNGSSSNKYAGVMRYAIRQHYEFEKLEQERNRMPFLSTVGIDVNDWVFPKDWADGKMAPIWFDTWDFAGQEVYQITHQYFISRRCLYLLVFNTVEKTAEGKYRVRDKRSLLQELKKWLNNIYCRIPNARFILVGTRKDQARNAQGYPTINPIINDPGEPNCEREEKI